MNTLEMALKTAGWSDEVIQHFIQSDSVAVSTIATSEWEIDVFDNQIEALDFPQKIDSTNYYVNANSEKSKGR